jgi:hypothetical protein
MSDILEKMRAAHDSRTHVAVPVPEYDDVWYFKPLTIGERSRIRKVAGDEEGLIYIETLILKASDSKGDGKFPDSPDARAVLAQMDFGVLKRVLEAAEGQTAPGPVKND